MKRRPMPFSTAVFQFDVDTASASGPCVVDDAREPLGDLGPSPARTRSAPTGSRRAADALQRVEDAVVVVVDLRRGRALEADVLGEDRMLVRKDLDDLAVARLGAELAADVADRADDVLRRGRRAARGSRVTSRASIAAASRAQPVDDDGLRAGSAPLVDIARPSASPSIASRAVR